MSNCFFQPRSSKRSTHKSRLLATTCQTNDINHVWVRGPVTETMWDCVSGHQAAAAGFDIILITFNSVSMKDSRIGSRSRNLSYLWWPSLSLRRTLIPLENAGLICAHVEDFQADYIIFYHLTARGWISFFAASVETKRCLSSSDTQLWLLSQLFTMRKLYYVYLSEKSQVMLCIKVLYKYIYIYI